MPAPDQLRPHQVARRGPMADRVHVKKLVFFCSADPPEETGETAAGTTEFIDVG